jgi:Mrp family chromosome partitioning ATPase/predicted Fe-Mo cluster-binding NifX family protein
MRSTLGECKGSCEAKEKPSESKNFSGVKNKIMVLSGKGGVGKSSVAACLALGLAERGFRVGVMDVDFHGPSIPVIFGLQGERVMGDESGIFPFEIRNNLKVISIGLFLEERDSAVIWRGPLKMKAITQFMEDIYWKELDYLIIDSPPGTGDEPLSVAQLIPDAWGLIVTTPQELAMADVRKSINFCRRIGMRLLGVVENMSGLVCPHCGEKIDVFGRGGAEDMAERMQVRLLASLPLDKDFAAWADRGGAKKGHYRDLPNVSEALDEMVEGVVEFTSFGEMPAQAEESGGSGEDLTARAEVPEKEREEDMEIYAIPTENGLLCAHFGHCEKFTLVEAGNGGEPAIREVCDAPPHEPGLLPRWLAEKGVKKVIAGGMGTRAQQIFAESGVEVICGAPPLEPLQVVKQYLEGTLELGDNACDH